jgi:archaellum biogenesis protein FlaJ (TadC family)
LVDSLIDILFGVEVLDVIYEFYSSIGVNVNNILDFFFSNFDKENCRLIGCACFYIIFSILFCAEMLCWKTVDGGDKYIKRF